MSIITVAEIGANHNGDLAKALAMVDAAKNAGATFAKFQKRTLPDPIPYAQREVMKETPWGWLDYVSYREKLEFDHDQFVKIDEHCIQTGMQWFASAWDIPAAEMLLHFMPEYLKIPSAKLTAFPLLRWCAANSDAQVVLSTGMSTMAEIRAAMRIIPDAVILHCNSTYPAPNNELNLRFIPKLKAEFPSNVVGWSGHETGIAPSVASVALGARFIERHFTLDRSMWGTDQAASLEPGGFARMVKDIHIVEAALGDGIKQVYDGEVESRQKLRG